MNSIELLELIYFLVGGIPVGYILLKTGFNTREMKRGFKTGLAIIFSTVIAIVSAVITFALKSFSIFKQEANVFLLIILILYAVALPAFFLKKKFVTKKIVAVTGKAEEKIEFEPVSTEDFERVEKEKNVELFERMKRVEKIEAPDEKEKIRRIIIEKAKLAGTQEKTGNEIKWNKVSKKNYKESPGISLKEETPIIKEKKKFFEKKEKTEKEVSEMVEVEESGKKEVITRLKAKLKEIHEKSLAEEGLPITETEKESEKALEEMEEKEIVGKKIGTQKPFEKTISPEERLAEARKKLERIAETKEKGFIKEESELEKLKEEAQEPVTETIAGKRGKASPGLEELVMPRAKIKVTLTKKSTDEKKSSGLFGGFKKKKN